jgi:hypothetical protein
MAPWIVWCCQPVADRGALGSTEQLDHRRLLGAGARRADRRTLGQCVDRRTRVLRLDADRSSPARVIRSGGGLSPRRVPR